VWRGREGATCPLREISWSRFVTFPPTILSNIAMFFGGAAMVCSLQTVRRGGMGRGREGGRSLEDDSLSVND
jgi:hypothetical protein